MDSDGHIKIADFGLAATNVHPSMKISDLAGTVGYMAPEVQQRKNYNSSVDFFSFGVILYELATGHFPFHKGENSNKVLRSIQKFKCPKNLDPQIKNILEGVFCKSPTKRKRFCETIRQHPFFADINWSDVSSGRAQPPYVMRPSEEVDYHQTVPLHTLLSSAEARKTPLTSEDRRLFQGFSYTSHRWR
ncbi:protein kinase C delta type-like [Engystomops pustulosus]|uniref:protein kinase C delta type-like n=1 Tax=Engystomops pustulosus TaxID=76066 RepID=UPI003AFAC660